MNILTNLLKDHQIGTWCKRAAWFILIIGIVEIAFNIYNGSSPLEATIFRQLIISAFGLLPTILFYFFILYAAGAIVDHVVSGTMEESYLDEEEENDDMVEDEEVTPGQTR